MSKESEILGYGEDALTLWALKNRLPEILKQLGDTASQSECLVFYRPSFGRAGGTGSAQFGEFDAIIVSRNDVYLVESKWDQLRERSKVRIKLRKEQIDRHRILRRIILGSTSGRSIGSDDFWDKYIGSTLSRLGKSTPKGSSTLLRRNLETILREISERCRTQANVNVRNVLLFFAKNVGKINVKIGAGIRFEVVKIAYGDSIKGNFVDLSQSF
jgi:hypothetical protein